MNKSVRQRAENYYGMYGTYNPFTIGIYLLNRTYGVGVCTKQYFLEKYSYVHIPTYIPEMSDSPLTAYSCAICIHLNRVFTYVPST
jgi:hypothetical protein